jgi:hypothetical protein
MLHNLCCIFHKILLISKFYFLLQIILSFLITHVLKLKCPAFCLQVNFAELRYLWNQVFTPLYVSTSWNEKHTKELTIWQKDVVWTYNMKTSVERFCFLYMCTRMYMYVCVCVVTVQFYETAGYLSTRVYTLTSSSYNGQMKNISSFLFIKVSGNFASSYPSFLHSTI